MIDEADIRAENVDRVRFRLFYHNEIPFRHYGALRVLVPVNVMSCLHIIPIAQSLPAECFR